MEVFEIKVKPFFDLPVPIEPWTKLCFRFSICFASVTLTFPKTSLKNLKPQQTQTEKRKKENFELCSVQKFRIKSKQENKPVHSRLTFFFFFFLLLSKGNLCCCCCCWNSSDHHHHHYHHLKVVLVVLKDDNGRGSSKAKNRRERERINDTKIET